MINSKLKFIPIQTKHYMFSHHCTHTKVIFINYKVKILQEDIVKKKVQLGKSMNWLKYEQGRYDTS